MCDWASENLVYLGSRLKKFLRHEGLVKDHEDPENLPVVSRTFGIMKSIDLVPTHLRDRLGTRKIRYHM